MNLAILKMNQLLKKLIESTLNKTTTTAAAATAVTATEKNDDNIILKDIDKNNYNIGFLIQYIVISLSSENCDIDLLNEKVKNFLETNVSINHLKLIILKCIYFNYIIKNNDDADDNEYDANINTNNNKSTTTTTTSKKASTKWRVYFDSEFFKKIGFPINIFYIPDDFVHNLYNDTFINNSLDNLNNIFDTILDTDNNTNNNNNLKNNTGIKYYDFFRKKILFAYLKIFV